MSLQETDEFLVQRGATPYKVDTQDLMAKVQDDDLLIVSRETQNYKITGLELKGSFGSGSINPGDNDITIDPPVGGSGTEKDPYILQSISASPYGSTVQSIETITIIGQAPETQVIWKDNSVDAGTRFSQITGITNAQGEWSGKLVYADTPDSTEDAVYVGKLQIGLVHYQWTVSQFNVIDSPTSVTSVSLIEADPEGDRFTSQSFVASSQVVDGVPTSLKTFDAHVDGTLSRQVQFEEPLESSTTGIVYSDNTVPLGGNWQEPPAGAFQGISPATQSSYTGNTAWIENLPNTQIIVNFFNKVVPANGYVDVWTWSGSDISVDFQDPSGTALGGVNSRTETAQGNNNVKVFRYTAIAADQLMSAIVVSRSTGGAFMSAIDWNGTFLSDQGTALTFAADADMEGLASGDTVNQISNFTEPLESSGTTTTPDQNGSVLTTQVASGQNLGDFFSEFGRTLIDTRNYGTTPTGIRCTLATPIENVETMHLVWGGASLQTQYWAHWARVGAADPWIRCASPWAEPDRTQQKIDWSSAFDVSSQIPSNGIVTEFEFGLSRVDGVTNASAQQSWGGLVINGETVISSQTLGTLTFANGTEMKALAAGDTVNQTRNFTEPLESQGSSPGPTYSSYLTCPTGFQTNGSTQTRGFDGDLNEPPYANSGAPGSEPPRITWDCSSFNITIEDTLEVYMVNATMPIKLDFIGGGSSTFSSGPAKTWSTVPNTFGTIKSITTYNKTNQASGIASAWCAGVRVNGTILLDGQQPDLPALVFAAGTDMSALAAGDNVSQTASSLSDNVSSQTVSSLATTLYNAKYSGKDNGDATLLSWDQAAVTQYGVEITGKPANVPEVTVVYFQFPGPCQPVFGFGDSITGPYPNAIYYSDNGSSWTQVYSSTTVLGDYVAPEAHQYWAWQNNYGGGWNASKYRITAAQDSTNVQKLTCASDLNLSLLNSNDLITQEGSTATGHVYNVTGSTVNLNDSVGTWGLGKLIFPANTTTGTVGSITGTTATLSSSSGTWVDGEDVTTGDKTTTGTVGSITDTTATLSSSSGTWVNGEDVTTGDKIAATGTVSGVSDTTATLSSSSGAWVNGLDVVGPEKTQVLDNTRLYCAFDSNGNVTDLQNNPQDPPYTTTASNPGLTFTFPATFPSGQTPDEELPGGTTFTVEVTATNTTSTDSKEATVQPVPAGPDAPLAGLTTLYNGNNTGQAITNGIDNVTNDGLIWIKARDNDTWNFLYDTLRGVNSLLFSNSSGDAQAAPALASFDNNGFSLNNESVSGHNQSGTKYVAWNFGKAAGYFDVVQFTSSGALETIPHSLGTKPGFVITKQIDGDSPWYCYHSAIGNGGYINLNQPVGSSPYADAWQNSDTDFKMNTGVFYGSGLKVIAYLFAEDTSGVIKCGTFSGTGAVDVGFEPQWVLLKAADTTSNWWIIDNKRAGTGTNNRGALYTNNNDTETDGVDWQFTSTGWTQTTIGYSNQIYVAIAAPPDTRSQTNEEFIESQAKFLTYDNRKQVKEGEEAINNRNKLAAELGLTQDQIEKVFKNG